MRCTSLLFIDSKFQKVANPCLTHEKPSQSNLGGFSALIIHFSPLEFKGLLKFFLASL
jgi:hypothetical protein